MIAGAEFKADTQGSRGFYELKLMVKTPKPYVGDETAVLSNLRHKVALSNDVDEEQGCLDDIFRDIDFNNRVDSTMQKLYTDDSTLWLATSNYKVAADWSLAVLCTVRYGSLRNFVEQNAVRTKHLAFKLPFYLLHLEYFPKSHNLETAPRRKAAFTFLKLSVLELLHIPLPDGVAVCCIIEHNSSFYMLNLESKSQGTDMDIPKVSSNLSCIDDDHHGNDAGAPLVSYPPAELTIEPNTDRLPNVLPRDLLKRQLPLIDKQYGVFPEGNEEDRLKIKQAPGSTTAPHGYTMLSKLWGLNKGVEKRKVEIRKRSFLYGDDASIYIPLYQNTSQDYVWVHVVTSNDIYIGSAALSNCDFGVVEPAKPKTCVLKHIEAVNPLNHKRLNISDFPNPGSVINTSMVRPKAPEPGYIVLSVVTPKHFGNFMDPVKVSHNSPQEYLGKATKASTSGGLQMLMANIKRVVAAYRTIKTLGAYITRVVQFKNMALSLFWMLYFIMALGFYQDKLLLFIIMPLVYYSLSCHSDSRRWVTSFLLRYPLLIAILPPRLTLKFLVLPKPVCIVCTKRKTFLHQNSHTVNDVVNSRIIVTRKVQVLDKKLRNSTSSNCVDTATRNERILTIEHRDTPMLTPKQAMNPFVSYTVHTGTQVETCNHKGIVHSYLAGMFLNQIEPSALTTLKRTNAENAIKAIHAIFYHPPPYPWGVVPWIQNVMFTIKFVFMTMFMTFAGGIDDIQTLHLLHRNRVCTKLNDEPVHPVEEHQSIRALRVPELLPRAQEFKKEWYENERRSVLGVYNKEHLRFYDRPNLSSEDGRRIVIPENLFAKAKLVVNDETDEQGWMYAKSWTSMWYKEPHAFTFVRRRKWITKHRKVSVFTEQEQSHLFPKAMSPRQLEAFTNRRFAERLPLHGRDITPDSSRSKNSPRDRKNLFKHQYIKGEPGYYKRSGSGYTSVHDIGVQNINAEIYPPGFEHHGDTEYNTPVSAIDDVPVRSRRMSALAAIKRGITHITKSGASRRNQVVSPLRCGNPSTVVRDAPGYKSRFKFSMLNMLRTRISSTDTYVKLSKDTNQKPVSKAGCRLQSPGPVIPVEEHIGDMPEGTERVADDIWLTDIENVDKLEITSPIRSPAENLLAYVIGASTKLLLAIFKMLLKLFTSLVMYTVPRKENSSIDLTNVITDDGAITRYRSRSGSTMPGCKLSIKSGRYSFHILRARKPCFLLGAKKRIYNAAKGYNCRRTVFAKTQKPLCPSVLLMHKKRRELARRNRPMDDDGEYETFSVVSPVDVRHLNAGHERFFSRQSCDIDDLEADEMFTDSSDNDCKTPENEKTVTLVQEQCTPMSEGNFTPATETTLTEMPPDGIADARNRRGRLYSYIKSIYQNRIMRRQAEIDDEAVAPDDAKQTSDYEGLETDNDMETEHKVTVIGMLRKARGQIVVGNYYLNLFSMRYEKFLNMFSWRHPSVTQLVMILCITIAIANYFFGVSSLLLLYVVAYFKSGYIAGTWERNIRQSVERHIDTCLSELEIYRPFWDLTSRQVSALARSIYAFSEVEVPSAVIRESATRGELAQAVTEKIIEQKLCKNWDRRNWVIHLFRQSPSQLDV
ncbi:tectonin beta-propeller repeat-containing protein, putative [Babesia ovis]|uniref:Tectonin beta-propeller repeat-containing protein, putative n=1 Tax=Babesia ovis TaxID=5869 RepID=A0A9W5WV12_BABOV|nr:tectonin beta-propeller repeat-containing protein, putative [Babesia ovis]